MIKVNNAKNVIYFLFALYFMMLCISSDQGTILRHTDKANSSSIGDATLHTLYSLYTVCSFNTLYTLYTLDTLLITS